jgi:hypothetical protein
MFASRQFLNRGFPNQLASGSLIVMALTASSIPARAYRPFDGTDAAVAAPGEVEIELQPAGRLRDATGTSLIAPATVFNYGLSEGWEAVLEGQGQAPLSSSGPTSLMAAGAFLTCPATRRPSGENRAERRDGVRRAASGQHRKFRCWRKSRRNRLATVGLGYDPPERRDGAHSRQSWRCFYWQHYRGTINMDGPAGCRVFL